MLHGLVAGIMQAIELRNIIDGVEAEMRIPLLSPLIKDIVRTRTSLPSRLPTNLGPPTLARQ